MALETPFRASNTACTPHKHPPAKTTVSDFFSDRFSSTAGPGRLAALMVKPAIKLIRPARKKLAIGACMDLAPRLSFALIISLWRSFLAVCFLSIVRHTRQGGGPQ